MFKGFEVAVVAVADDVDEVDVHDILGVIQGDFFE